MALKKYRRMRRFGKSSEPFGTTRDERSPGRTARPAKAKKSAPAGVKRPRRKVAPTLTAITNRVKPMLATLVDGAFDRAGWIFEAKWDGYRTITEIRDGHVELYSRSHKALTRKFQALVPELAQLGHNVVLDGEVAVLDQNGKSSFPLLQTYLRTGEGKLVYYVFDVLTLDGHDLRDLPLLRRKETLRHILPELPLVRYSEHIEERGSDFFRALRDQGLEGMIAKEASSPYREGKRLGEWVKIKATARQEAVIAGFTEQEGRLGPLILGVYAEGKLVPVGQAETGLSGVDAPRLHAKLARLVQAGCPFSDEPEAVEPVRWVRPKLVCEIAFQEWTEAGLMRTAAYLGLREDKAARNVRRERAKPVAKVLRRAERHFLSVIKGEKKRRKAGTGKVAQPALRLIASQTARSGEGTEIATGRPWAAPPEVAPAPAGKKPRLTQLEKIYWPGEGLRKKDLVDYYRRVAPVLLPYLSDRPQALHRYPDGIAGEGVFHHDVGDDMPHWVPTAKIRSVSNERELVYLMCQDEATLLYLADLGCIELSPWHSRIPKLDYPDYLVLDLEPDDLELDKVIETAHAARKLLDSLGAPSYPKTSGANGLHLYVPLGARYHYDQVKRFAELVAHLVSQRIPRLTSVVRSPVRREKRVYLDFLQNRRGKSLVAPYSVRPRPGAPVSTPLRWDEVKRGLDPTSFTLRTLPRRLDAVGDVFAPVLGEGIDLLACLDRLAGN